MNIFKTPEIEQLRKQYPLNAEYYKLKSIYDLEDAPYICLGINPVCKRLKIWFQPIKAEIPVTSLQPICRIKELINDAIQINELSCLHTINGATKIKSIELYAWLKSNGLPIHEQLFEHFIKKIEDLDNINLLKNESAELKTGLEDLQKGNDLLKLELAKKEEEISELKKTLKDTPVPTQEKLIYYLIDLLRTKGDFSEDDLKNLPKALENRLSKCFLEAPTVRSITTALTRAQSHCPDRENYNAFVKTHIDISVNEQDTVRMSNKGFNKLKERL